MTETLTPFDRETFDPVNNREDRKYLRILRCQGNRRRNTLGWLHSEWSSHLNEDQQRRCRQYSRSSNFYSHFKWGPRNDGSGLHAPIKGNYLDLACGDSCDAACASMEYGMTSTAIDLFPPSQFSYKYPEGAEFKFIQADIVESIPVEKASIDYAVLTAAIDLIHPEERVLVYLNIHEVLKTGGQFFMTMQRLSRGWGIDGPQEARLLKYAGFTLAWKSTSHSIKALKNP